ncbi:hypothetical protein HF295_04540 [Hujiaoplasma nucleasis]|uniref:Uncharacterized protein n=1 Tax=Hujiaoplasma nucleasis TaxID=2725268 RepID=A0A7L6N4K3_9MOLU|nr:hypothetical protein [Hujiaoplasma nucleasis]QLY40168.1 hypothetical protein HF295_04540 [Hujiaoplasma nucleasis]
MKLIFLDRHTLQYKDNARISNNYQLVLDMVLIKRSSFKVNKININCKIGDILVLKTDKFSYIGILESIELNDDFTSMIKSLDFREIFNLDTPAISFSGDVADYIYQVITSHFKNNSDSMQNLNYLTIEKETSVNGQLNFDSDKIINISKIFELGSKSYGLSFSTDVTYLRGRITGIVFRILPVKSGIKMRSDFSSILNIKTNDSTSQLINKVIFYPRSDNQIHKSIKTYYLLTNGHITESPIPDKRYNSVMSRTYMYTDKDFDTLDTKARSDMVKSKLDHNIEFMIDMNNKVFIPFENINLGDYVSFIHKGKTYESIVTGISFKDSMNYALVTLGEYRVKLTEKIQLLSNNKSKQTTSNITITNTNIDGGEF